MKAFKIQNTIYRPVDAEEIILTKFVWENGNTGQTEYWIEIYYHQGEKTTVYLGSVEEVAMKMYEAITTEIFNDIQVLAR